MILLRFENSRNVEMYLAQTGLFWIRDPELAADSSSQQIGNLCVSWYCSDPARVG